MLRYDKLTLHRSFVDRDMFMRYFGGGLGHIATAVQATADDATMDADEDTSARHPQEVGDFGTGMPPTDQGSHEVLCQVGSNLGRDMTDDHEDVDQAPASDDEEHDSDVEDSVDDMSVGSDESNGGGDHASVFGDGDDTLGPEDGEDDGFFDMGYGAL